MLFASSGAQASFCTVDTHNLVYACANSPFAFTGTVEGVTAVGERSTYRVHIRVHRSLRGEAPPEIDVWMGEYCDSGAESICVMSSDSADVFELGDDVAVFFDDAEASADEVRTISLCTYTVQLDGDALQADPCAEQALAAERTRLETHGLVEESSRETSVAVPPSRGGCASCAVQPAQSWAGCFLSVFVVMAWSWRRRR